VRRVFIGCSSPHGTQSQDEQYDEIQIVVADTGRGAPVDWLPKAGQPFSRADEARGGKPGAGLGLQLVSRVMQMHGGRLELRNLPATGFEAKLVWKGVASS